MQDSDPDHEQEGQEEGARGPDRFGYTWEEELEQPHLAVLKEPLGPDITPFASSSGRATPAGSRRSIRERLGGRIRASRTVDGSVSSSVVSRASRASRREGALIHPSPTTEAHLPKPASEPASIVTEPIHPVTDHALEAHVALAGRRSWRGRGAAPSGSVSSLDDSSASQPPTLPCPADPSLLCGGNGQQGPSSTVPRSLPPASTSPQDVAAASSPTVTSNAASADLVPVLLPDLAVGTVQKEDSRKSFKDMLFPSRSPTTTSRKSATQPRESAPAPAASLAPAHPPTVDGDGSIPPAPASAPGLDPALAVVHIAPIVNPPTLVLPQPGQPVPNAAPDFSQFITQVAPQPAPPDPALRKGRSSAAHPPADAVGESTPPRPPGDEEADDDDEGRDTATSLPSRTESQRNMNQSSSSGNPVQPICPVSVKPASPSPVKRSLLQRLASRPRLRRVPVTPKVASRWFNRRTPSANTTTNNNNNHINCKPWPPHHFQSKAASCWSCLFPSYDYANYDRDTDRPDSRDSSLHQRTAGIKTRKKASPLMASILAGSPRMDEGDLLPPVAFEDRNKKCLVLDLDETLVHSAFKANHQADFVVPLVIEGATHEVFVLLRPHVAQFIEEVSPYYELVVFTASLNQYADPVIDRLDPRRLIRHRLFRNACSNLNGSYVKDLSQLGRPLASTIIIDNSPTCYAMQPENAIPCTSWFSDQQDTELLELIPMLRDLSEAVDVRVALSDLEASPGSTPTDSIFFSSAVASLTPSTSVNHSSSVTPNP